MPKASVLISTYNRPKWLSEAIQSIIDQSMKDWELLIINDGGENVQEVVDSFNDNRITYFHSTYNEGPGYRFNELLGMAKGDYIAYLGDDDKYYPNHLSVLCDALDDHPEVDVAYSDLYSVDCFVDNNYDRIPLSKRITVSRDFNRNFEFFHNHVLHGSMMHRRELATRIEGFVKGVTSLIEWGFLRKAAMITDFLHIDALTGEYYTPVGGGDRLSHRARQNKNAFEFNKLKIKAARPPKPWSKIKTVDVIYPMIKYLNLERLAHMMHAFSYPVNYIIPVYDHSVEVMTNCLGNLAQLSNIEILPISKGNKIWDFYQTAIDQSEADYLFLATDTLLPQAVESRIMGGLEYLGKRKTWLEGVRWYCESDISTLDILVDRSSFLNNGFSLMMNDIIEEIEKGYLPKEFKWDRLITESKTAFNQGEFEKSYQKLKEGMAIEAGTPTKQYAIEMLTNLCILTNRAYEAEQLCEKLFSKGYMVDNTWRLARLAAATGKASLASAYIKNWLNMMDITKDKIKRLPIGIGGETQLQWVLTYLGIRGI